MFKKALASTALAIGVAGAAFAAQAKLSPQIADYYKKSDALTMKRDIAGLEKLFNAATTADYVAVGAPDKTGKVQKGDRVRHLATMRRALGAIKSFSKVDRKITKVTSTKDSTTVWASVSLAGTVADPSGKSHTLTVNENDTYQWVRVGRDWKLKGAAVLSSKTTVDGAPMKAR